VTGVSLFTGIAVAVQFASQVPLGADLSVLLSTDWSRPGKLQNSEAGIISKY
jgi:hypothetical protein